MKDCAIYLLSNQGTLPETNSSSQVENGELEWVGTLLSFFGALLAPW